MSINKILLIVIIIIGAVSLTSTLFTVLSFRENAPVAISPTGPGGLSKEEPAARYALPSAAIPSPQEIEIGIKKRQDARKEREAMRRQIESESARRRTVKKMAAPKEEGVPAVELKESISPTKEEEEEMKSGGLASY
jgi:hypothetical protein